MKKLLGILFSLALLSIFASPTQAFEISPAVKDIFLDNGEIYFGEVEVTNNEKAPITLSPTVQSYDPKNESYIDQEPLTAVSKEEFTLKPGDSKKVKYTISVKEDQPEGSYFDLVLFIVDEKNDPKALVNINKGFGSLLAIHVTNPASSVESVFFQKADTKLTLLERGIPGIKPTKFKYEFTNNSDFVFKPEGEIRIIDADGRLIAENFEINPSESRIFPGESMSEVYETELWTLDNIKSAKEIIARTYSGFGTNYITNKVSVSIILPIAVVGGAVIIVVVALTTTGVVKLIKRRKKSSESS